MGEAAGLKWDAIMLDQTVIYIPHSAPFPVTIGFFVIMAQLDVIFQIMGVRKIV